jgi:hypothetical protein
MNEFHPHLEILPTAQMRLWHELSSVPDQFVLYGNIIQREKNTLSAIVERGDPVKVSFFGVPKLAQLAPAHITALSYFDDGNLRELPDDLRLRLVESAREVDLDLLPVIGAEFQRSNADYGLEQ